MAVIVVEAGAGGGGAVAQALRVLGEDVAIAADPEAVARAPRLIVVGGGPFAAARRTLGLGLDEAIRLAALRGAPLLGIGTGFLVLLAGVDGSTRARGLGLLAGRAGPLAGGFEPGGRAARVPHVGPAEVEFLCRAGAFVDVAARAELFFAHDLAIRDVPAEQVAGTCVHGEPLVVAVLAGTRAGVLFHPERSGAAGLSLLSGFARWSP
jgi:glutamine amidotransferase